MPGGGGAVSSFLAYNEARRWSRHKEEFGHGSPEGIAAPEAANNTVACAALIPLLSLGIPSSNSAAVLLGGFLMHGLVPGPMLFVKDTNVITGLFAGLLAANIAMVVIGYLIMGPCIWLVSRPKPYLMAFIYALVVSGVYAIETSEFQVGLALGFGVIGYVLRKFEFDPTPFLLAFVLGDHLEVNFRRSLAMSDGHFGIFFQGSAARAFVGVLALLVVLRLAAIALGYRKSFVKK